MINIDNYIMFTKVINQGSFNDYLDEASELADEKQMPVMVEPPYTRKFIVMPRG